MRYLVLPVAAVVDRVMLAYPIQSVNIFPGSPLECQVDTTWARVLIQPSIVLLVQKHAVSAPPA